VKAVEEKRCYNKIRHKSKAVSYSKRGSNVDCAIYTVSQKKGRHYTLVHIFAKY